MLSPYWSHRNEEKFPQPETFNPVYTKYYSLTVASLASIYVVYSHTISVFSLAYLRHVGPTSLHYRIPFDVGIGIIHML